MNTESLFSAPVRRLSLATVGVLLVSVIITAGMPAYLPFDQANAIGLPIILFPITWLVLFLWVLFDKKLLRVALLLTALGVVHIICITFGLGVF